jgi:hypothetical protein
MCLRTNRIVIHNAAISRPPVAARSVAASANGYPPAGHVPICEAAGAWPVPSGRRRPKAS